MTPERIVPLSEYHRLPPALGAEFYKRQLEVVCNNATLALFIMDEHQHCVYMNPAAEILTGYSLSETQGRALHDVIHHTRPDGSPYPLCECPIDQVFPQNNREQGEEVFVHKDGHFYPVAYTASPVREGERTIGTIIEVRDITQEKLDEQARQDVKTILASISDGFYTLDHSWRLTYVNQRYCQMVGMQPAELLGQNIWELFPAAVDTEAYVQFHQAVAEQTPRQFDYHYAPWNCWHDHRIYPSSTGLTVLLADITARKQTEAALQKSEERLSLAIDSAGMATWDIDMQTGKGVWSHSHFAMLGYEPTANGEATAELWHGLVHPDDLEGVMQAVVQARQTHRLYSKEYRIRRADTGEIRWLKAFGRFVVDAARQTERFVGVLFDTSELKQAEAAQRQSEDQLRMASQGGNFGLWYWDMQTDSLTWTDRAKQMFGLPTDTVMSMQVFLEAIHPDDRPFVQGIVAELQANQPHLEIDYRTRWADGTVRWILARGDCDYNANGELIATRGVLLDITDRKRAELNDQFINQLEARLRQLADAEQMAWEVVSSMGSYLEVDRCIWTEIDAGTQTATVRHDWYQLDMPSAVGVYQLADFALPNLIDRYHRGEAVAVGNVATHPWTASFVDNYIPHGVHAYVAVPCAVEGIWMAMLVVSAKTPRSWRSDEVALLQEVVARLWLLIEHTRAIQQLRQSEAEFRLLANAMPQIVWIADASGKIEFTNDRWTEYTGLTSEQSRDPVLREQFIPPADRERLQADFMQAQANRALYQSQFRLIQPDGSTLHFLTRAVPLLDEQGQIRKWYGTSTDISDRVQLESDRERILRQEQAAREAAEHANQIKDEFLAVVSHELRTPLNPILGWSKLLQQGKLEVSIARQALATIARNAQLQAQLIDDLLDISRILRGKLSLHILPVDLRAVVAAAIETVRLAAEAKSLSIELSIEPAAVCGAAGFGTVMGDAGRLQQVVWNLLSNAVKFTPCQGQIRAALTQSATHAQLQVIDTGKGIHPNFLPHLFEHFRQEDSATTRRFGGLGLGLAIARQIVELHGGTLAAESAGEGQGATFTVQIPLALQVNHPVTLAACPEAAGDLSDIRILVVDDEPDSREILAFVLEQAGAVVTAVGSGIEALRIVEQRPPDLIVSDIGMPEMDGYRLMQQIRSSERGSQIPAVALTAYAGEFDRQRALQAGFQRHLAKPIQPAVILTMLTQLWEQRGGTT